MKGIATWMVAALFAMVVGLVSWPGQAQMERRPGSFFIGDTDGDGIVAPRDVFGLQFKIIRPSTEFPEVVPSNGDNLDLDGDGAIGPGDYSILLSWVLDNYGGYAGKPQQAVPVYQRYSSSSGEIGARVLAGGTAPRSGWGVIFSLDTLPPNCAEVRLIGRRVDPQPGQGRDQYITGTRVFEYTDSGANGGLARVSLINVEECSSDHPIRFEVSLPSDAEAGVSGNRFPSPLPGATATVYAGQSGWFELCGGDACSAAGDGILPIVSKPLLASGSAGSLHVTSGTNYRSWNGSSWSEIHSIPFHADSLAIDPMTNQPAVGATVLGEVYLVKWTGVAWVGIGGSETGTGLSDSPSQVSDQPTVAVAPNGRPGIAWREILDSSNSRIRFKRWNGIAWEELAGLDSEVGGVNSGSPSLAIDSSGMPLIAWVKSDSSHHNAKIYLKKWDGSAWVELGGSGSGQGVFALNIGGGPILKINSTGNPAISFVDDGGYLNSYYYKMILQWNGSSWDSPYMFSSPLLLSMYASYSFALGADDYPVFASDGDMFYPYPIFLERWNGSDWNGFFGGADKIQSCTDNGFDSLNFNRWPFITAAGNYLAVAWEKSAAPEQGCLGSGIYIKMYQIN